MRAVPPPKEQMFDRSKGKEWLNDGSVHYGEREEFEDPRRIVRRTLYFEQPQRDVRIQRCGSKKPVRISRGLSEGSVRRHDNSA